jgi:hypothetical protein
MMTTLLALLKKSFGESVPALHPSFLFSFLPSLFFIHIIAGCNIRHHWRIVRGREKIQSCLG